MKRFSLTLCRIEEAQVLIQQPVLSLPPPPFRYFQHDEGPLQVCTSRPLKSIVYLHLSV